MRMAKTKTHRVAIARIREHKQSPASPDGMSMDAGLCHGYAVWRLTHQPSV